MLRDFYIYKVTHKITNEYYIGMRTKPIGCKLKSDWYIYDNYWGSQQGWLEMKKLNKIEKSKILIKEIISLHYNTTQKEVAIIESDLIKANIKDPLNRNYHYDYSGGFIVGYKNPSIKRKNKKYAPTSIAFYNDVPYRLNELNKLLCIGFLDSLKLIYDGTIIPMENYIEDNYYTHTKKLVIFNELKTVLNWTHDSRLDSNKFLKSTHLLKWYLDKENIQYREISKDEMSNIRSASQIGIKKPKVSEYLRINNPSKRQDVRAKISAANKFKKRIKKECPHCNKIVGSSNYYHFDNCINKEGNENIDRTKGSYIKKRNILTCPNCGKQCKGKNKWHFDNCKQI